ncbi:hypothetical protein O4214_14710 [Rhodococcus erythropolis]|uniref:P-type ATPase n=1 Tax=Rhodococcus erythropolis TaxID=1833 RepID=UPI001E364FD2|nr:MULTISPECIES: hypothetical protein [Rhodococcus erythropolis group]MCD2104633.1 hypothetical protein [Rhodococcus qingshengii]MCZ4525241.1 hypothetical protein [Rhodococcus erythropolis]
MSLIRDLFQRLTTKAESLLLIATVSVLAGGVLAWSLDQRAVADGMWALGTIAALLPAGWWVVDGLRRGRAGVDVIAVLSLLGTILVGEYLAGALIAVMLATGRTLDAAANRRAARDLRSLREHVPRIAQREERGQLRTVAVDEIEPGDRIFLSSGDVVPTDGWIVGEPAVFDESALNPLGLLLLHACGGKAPDHSASQARPLRQLISVFAAVSIPCTARTLAQYNVIAAAIPSTAVLDV